MWSFLKFKCPWYRIFNAPVSLKHYTEQKGCYFLLVNDGLILLLWGYLKIV